MTKTTILNGIKELLESPSGVFALLTLAAITYCTIKVPSVGGMAFAAFCAVIPAVLAFCEHKEQMATINQTNIAVDANPTNADMPKRGQL